MKKPITKEQIYKITTVALFILVLLFIVGSLITNSFQRGYDQGFSDGQVSVAIEQTQTRNIFWINNDTIVSNTIQEICGEI